MSRATNSGAGELSLSAGGMRRLAEELARAEEQLEAALADVRRGKQRLLHEIDCAERVIKYGVAL